MVYHTWLWIDSRIKYRIGGRLAKDWPWHWCIQQPLAVGFPRNLMKTQDVTAISIFHCFYLPLFLSTLSHKCHTSVETIPPNCAVRRAPLGRNEIKTGKRLPETHGRLELIARVENCLFLFLPSQLVIEPDMKQCLHMGSRKVWWK